MRALADAAMSRRCCGRGRMRRSRLAGGGSLQRRRVSEWAAAEKAAAADAPMGVLQSRGRSSEDVAGRGRSRLGVDEVRRVDRSLGVVAARATQLGRGAWATAAGGTRARAARARGRERVQRRRWRAGGGMAILVRVREADMVVLQSGWLAFWHQRQARMGCAPL